MEDENVCGIIFPYSDYYDEHGCLKKECHNDTHVFQTKDGKLIGWQEDGECWCGCWDAWESGKGEVCVIHREVKNINEEL